MKVWDILARKVLGILEKESGDRTAAVLTWAGFSPDGRLLAILRADGSLKLYDIAKRKEKGALKDLLSPAAISPDGRSLAIVTEEGKLRLWDIARKQFSPSFGSNSKTIVQFSPDGRALESGSNNGEVKLWDVSRRKEILILKGLSNEVTAIAFSPDGRTLSAGDQIGTAKLWDLASQQELATLQEPFAREDSQKSSDPEKAQIYSLMFSNDGRRLISMRADGSIRFYLAATDEEIARQRRK